ncbi:hypothetical protein GOHSU_04_01760 [Gordonia hirsuta DSM 44140 = NBRC 16056]|uniref:Uncharacterized protein n=1 Tax=Gordonia hirsuta DSM 44140 = NBRC 16056 TaxID=1121927 RepID=L7L6B7_9ACTN|nr:hypothetical protein [Gordonia hirsuta]GAC56306.1 hypothetical protein GOHSU_04_01760 [Gordonia hirsuta DSM 44140 = NBRC 16056]
MTKNSQGIVDEIDFSAVLERQDQGGVKLTFTVPTDVTGQSDKVSALTLKSHLREAKARLVEDGMREAAADAFLAPVTALAEDPSYWRLQSRGLIVFLAEGFFLPLRVPIELTESLTVGDEFNLLPVAPVIASDRKLYVLALAQNSVRLFDSTRNVIEELPLENVPASFDEVIDELPERVIDVRSGSAGADGVPSFQGSGGDIDRTLVEKYIRAVGQAIGTRLGTARSQALVLAAVAEYLPIFTASCPYPAIVDGVIAGNPEHAQPDDLRSAAWQVVNTEETAREQAEQERARSLAHSGKGAFDLAEIARAAGEGRVDTLFLSRDDAQITGEQPRELANRGLLGTLKAGGTVRTLGDLDGEALATFRY